MYQDCAMKKAPARKTIAKSCRALLKIFEPGLKGRSKKKYQK